MNNYEAESIDIDLAEQDALTAERLQELARQGKVFICHGPISQEKLHRLELEKLRRWNAAAAGSTPAPKEAPRD